MKLYHNSNNTFLLIRVIILLMTILPRVANAQNDRISASLPVIGEKVLWSLDKATGWTKNREGQWIEGKNKIHQAAMSVSNKAEWEKETNSLGKDNFINYELRDIKISGMDFYLFTKVMHYGSWTYPDSQHGWNPQDRVYYAVIKKNEAKIEKNNFDPEAKAVTYQTTIYFLSYLPHDSTYLNKIALMVNELDISNADYRKYGTVRTLLISYKQLADNKTCRFELYAGGINSSGVDMLPKYSSEHLVNVFSDFYFECPKEKLDGLIKIIEPKSGR